MNTKVRLVRFLSAIPYWEPLFKSAEIYVAAKSGAHSWRLAHNGELAVLEALAGTLETVLDVGANVGEWAAEALKRNPRAVVHCFEPCSATYDRLVNNLAGQRIVLNRCGLSDKSGTGEVHLIDETSEANSLFRQSGVPDQPVPARSEKVDLTSIDEYASENNLSKIDFLKIDCEGNEIPVLRGASKTISKNIVKAVQFEYNVTYLPGRFQLKDAFDLLQPCGFRLYKITPRRLIFKENYSVTDEDYRFSNYLAIAKGYDAPRFS